MADHSIVASYIDHLKGQIGDRFGHHERTELCDYARHHFESLDRCNALFHGVSRAIHLTEVVLATFQGRWLVAGSVESSEFRHVLLAVWCHSAAFADTLEDDRLPRGVPNDGWWPWVHDRSARLCVRAAETVGGLDVAKLIALSQACGFSLDAVEKTEPVITATSTVELVELVRAAWLVSLATDGDQANKIKPLWTALRYWSGQDTGSSLGLEVQPPKWVDFPAHWKRTLSLWSKTAMGPAIELLELTEDGRGHLLNLQRALS
jgi:hypothetical protein